jgi:hypothetical protein
MAVVAGVVQRPQDAAADHDRVSFFLLVVRKG